MRYYTFKHIPCKSFEKDPHGNRSGDEYVHGGGGSGYSRSLTCDTSYPKKNGVCVNVRTSRSCLMRREECTFPTPRTTMSHASYPNANVSYFQYGLMLEVEGEITRYSKWRKFDETEVNGCGYTGFSLVLDDNCYTTFITPHAVE